jgi:hypothetical protein
MPLFEEINLETITQDDKIFVNASQLAWHLAKAMQEFYQETNSLMEKNGKLPIEELCFFNGILEGMNNVVLLLSQGGLEQNFHNNVDTVEDLLEMFRKNDGK